MCPKSFIVSDFDLGPLLQGQMWFFVPIIRAGTGAEKRHRVLALSQPARIRVTARFSSYH